MSSDSKIEICAGLGLPHLDATHRLNPVLSSAIKKSVQVPCAREGPYWSADFFGLTSSTLFVEATDSQRNEILCLCSNSLLYEAYFIEKSGMAFAAKMSLLSRSTEERMLYSMFASDEASHFELIRAFIDRPPEDEATNPFLLLLSDLIENGSRNTLVFVIQIVLEGWGLTHYRSIAAGCEDHELKAALESILKDEARHHGSGLVLFEKEDLNAQSKKHIVDAMTRFLQMVQVGPQAVVHAVDSVLGPLTKLQKLCLFEDLNAQDHSADRLNELRQLMLKANVIEFVAELDAKGVFRPFSPQECV
jgi:hypothetical protein